jgi:hypothetical protein
LLADHRQLGSNPEIGNVRVGDDSSRMRSG